MIGLSHWTKCRNIPTNIKLKSFIFCIYWNIFYHSQAFSFPPSLESFIQHMPVSMSVLFAGTLATNVWQFWQLYYLKFLPLLQTYHTLSQSSFPICQPQKLNQSGAITQFGSSLPQEGDNVPGTLTGPKKVLSTMVNIFHSIDPIIFAEPQGNVCYYHAMIQG